MEVARTREVSYQNMKGWVAIIACKKTLLTIFLIAQILLLAGMGSFPNQKPEKCALCGRDVHKTTETLVTLEEGKEKKACCIKCAFKYEAENSMKALSIKVVGFDTGEIINAQDALYVVGSDFTPCCSKKVMVDQTKTPFVLCYDRCLPSIIAFKAREEALKFMKEHGGRISTFKELETVEK